jgi:hypothetical protein
MSEEGYRVPDVCRIVGISYRSHCSGFGRPWSI